MVKITEQNSNVDTSYLVQTINNNEVLEEHIVRCKSTELEKDGVSYFLLFDKNAQRRWQTDAHNSHLHVQSKLNHLQVAFHHQIQK